MWNYHVDESARGRYDMILGRNIWTELGLNLKFSDHVVEADNGTLKESTAPISDIGTYESTDLETEKITPE